MTLNRFVRSIAVAAAIAATAAGISSCDSVIYDDADDCSVTYRIPVRFTHNILDADALASQVSNLTLYLFSDADGSLVHTQSLAVSALSAPDAAFTVGELQPGSYSYTVWATGTSPVSSPVAFAIGGGNAPATHADLTATLPLGGDATAGWHADSDITPLFWGRTEGAEVKADVYGTVNLPAVDLWKDTNVIKVVLAHAGNQTIDPADFAIAVEADNSRLSSLNDVVPFATVAHRPWATTLLTPDTDAAGRGDAATAFMTEHSTGRLIAGSDTRLSVTRLSDGARIIDLNLPSLLTLVKGHYQANWSNQEYLDRMDEHTLMFFIDSNNGWYMAGGIHVNGWRVVPGQSEDI